MFKVLVDFIENVIKLSGAAAYFSLIDLTGSQLDKPC